MPPKRKAATTKEKEMSEVEAVKKDVKKKGATKKIDETEIDAAETNGISKPKRGRKAIANKGKPELEDKNDHEKADDSEEETVETNATMKSKKGRKAVTNKEKPQFEEKDNHEVADETEEDTVETNNTTKPKKGRKAVVNKEKEEDKNDHEQGGELEEDAAEMSVPPKSKKGRKAKEEPVPVESEDKNDEKDEDSPLEEPVKEKKGRGKKTAAAKDEDEEVPKRGRKQAKAPVYEDYDSEEEKDETEKPKGRGRKKKVESEDTGDSEKSKSKGRPKREAQPVATTSGETMNPTETNYDKIDFTCTRKNALGKPHNFVISSWNVDGLRAWLKKGGLEYIQYEKPDIFCIQESKCAEEKMPTEMKELSGYEQYWQNSDKDGYAGVGLFSRKKPLNVEYGIGVPDHDNEGRCVTAEFEDFYVISVYVPNAGRKLVTLPKRLEWNKAFKKYIKSLDKKKPVIVCGDMNVAHLEIDLANPKTNAKNAGFTKEEREDMTQFLADGYIDTYRELYPDKTGAYTFWTYMMKSRSKNVGWRLDYFIVSQRLVDSICDNVIRSEVLGADHCPIALFLHV